MTFDYTFLAAASASVHASSTCLYSFSVFCFVLHYPLNHLRPSIIVVSDRKGCPERESTEAMLTTSKDWKVVSNDSSATSTYGIEDGQLTKTSSSPDTMTKCPSTTNFSFWWSVEEQLPSSGSTGVPKDSCKPG